MEPALTRVSRETHRVLEIACVAERKSMTDLLRPVVEDYATRLADEPEIAAMLKEARKYEARKKGRGASARHQAREARSLVATFVLRELTPGRAYEALKRPEKAHGSV